LHDRRAWPRYLLSRPLLGLLSGSNLNPSVPVAALDVSAEGVALFAPRVPAVGDVVQLELQDGPVSLRRPLLLRVVYLRPEATGGHRLGGAFLVPLPAADLNALRNWSP
jgi:PilZ domain